MGNIVLYNKRKNTDLQYINNILFSQPIIKPEVKIERL